MSPPAGLALLFSGHMVDAPDRPTTRFPPDRADVAAAAIGDAIGALLAAGIAPAPVISSAACGGDILFQECCAEVGLTTEICLALPPEEFRAESVSFAGPDWEARYDRLLARVPHHVVDAEPGTTVWRRCDEWMLERARGSGAASVVLLALWDGRDPGEGGGTGHMVELVRAAGGEVRVLDTRTLFGLD